MNWKEYEKEIHEQFQDMYPDSEITHNTTLPGRYSKANRQIDVLIEDHVAGNRIRIVVDGKHFTKKIDVKGVECFIGMMQDISADKGLLITQKGYSQAAIKRAYNDPNRIELDILNFEELKQFQGFGAIPYSGKHGVLMPSPFGWVIDSTRRDGFLAALYQRGLTFDKAVKNNEFIYVNIFSKTNKIKDLEAFCKMHELFTLKHASKAKFSYINTVKRKKEKTLLRIIDIETYPTLEYTGLVEFKEFIFFCVLFTPEELKEKNIKKLEHILLKVLPFNINMDNVHESNLQLLDQQLGCAVNDEEKAAILIAQGDLLKSLLRFEDSEDKYKTSRQTFVTSYGAIKGLLDLYLLMNRSEFELNSVIDELFDLDPTNPTVCQDVLFLFSKYERLEDVFMVFKRKLKDFSAQKDVQANIYFHLGILSIDANKKQDAKRYFNIAKEYFIESVGSGHHVIGLIDENLKELLNEI